MAGKKLIKSEMKFYELVEIATRDIHSALLTNGSNGMRQAIYLWMAKAIEWHTGDKIP